ncbi:MAG: HI0074 family nucleotidyltransferase substrate-binding subunit [Ignavibacteriae bacterium]|nr:HI0074 family nucleotidyltransferase substrate-binding subunit [Ignavibacteriota bacterium]
MREELTHSIGLLEKAYITLEDGINSAVSDLEKDGVIQRFEYSFELLWKTLKIFLFDQGIICKSPKDCLKSAFKFGLIENDEAFLNMLEDRNIMSHLYSREDSVLIFENIKKSHSINMCNLIKNIKKISG